MRVAAAIALCAILAGSSAAAELPAAIAAPGEVTVLRVHAQGAQIYECRAAPGGAAQWQLREPIAVLFRDGKSVGRHYAGPTWEIGDTVVMAKVAARAAAPNPAKDIPWLKLEITVQADDGPLVDAVTIQRVDTAGGLLEGPCPTAGDLRSEAYAADYVFLKKPQ